jgi:hypothetical protein
MSARSCAANYATRRRPRRKGHTDACPCLKLRSRRRTLWPSGVTPALTAGTRPTTRSTRRCAGAFSTCGGRRRAANYRHGKQAMTARWRSSSCSTSFPATCSVATPGPTPAMRWRARRRTAPSIAAWTRVSIRSCVNSCICPSCSEHLADQLRCIELSRKAGLAESAKWAEHHAGIIRRFSRFPHRNRILGRATTPEEQAFLDDGGFSP